jgi:hypothetical protein
VFSHLLTFSVPLRVREVNRDGRHEELLMTGEWLLLDNVVKTGSVDFHAFLREPKLGVALKGNEMPAARDSFLCQGKIL